MKRVFRKNQVIITALTLMIAVAGYVSYTKAGPGEDVLKTASDEVADTADTYDFSSEVKLNREQVRGKNKEALMEIIDSTSISDAQKQDAVNTMIEMTNIAERENAAELLLEAKGFQDAVVSVTDNSADVVLDMGDVTDAKRAQVEDIVKRKTGIAEENIVITPISGAQAGQK